MTENSDIVRAEPFNGARPGPSRFNKRVTYGGLVFLSGQADDSQGYPEFPGDYKKQAQLIFKKIDELLINAGTSKKRILKMTVLLRDIDEGIAAFNEAWDEWSDKDNLPARTTMEAKMVRPDMLVEVEAIAAL